VRMRYIDHSDEVIYAHPSKSDVQAVAVGSDGVSRLIVK
jgi:hypothetical protein